mmetsp:Transcript_3750/g.5738  ORF Transcript_3750/g.5738 Transcript_3750/m.5738 type:complete len:145 (-) Transcript_3750:60-494(-)
MNKVDKLLVKKLTENAMLPTRGSANSAGLDLYSAESLVIGPKQRGVVSTGLAVAVESGHYGRVAPRSGLALNHGIDTLAGVVDSDYRGELKVILYNTSEDEFPIRIGSRVAQFIIEKISMPEVQEVQDLNLTGRGSNGFGSTGF